MVRVSISRHSFSKSNFNHLFRTAIFTGLILALAATAAYSAACTGPLTGIWNLSLNQTGQCVGNVCGSPFNFSLPPGTIFPIAVCQIGNNLTGSFEVPGAPGLGGSSKFVLKGTVTPAGQDGVLDDVVNFTVVRSSSFNFAPCSFKQSDNMTGHGVVKSARSLSGDLDHTSDVNVTCNSPGCSSARFHCTQGGEFTVNVSDVGFSNISDSSGITKAKVQTTGVQWINIDNNKFLDLMLIGKDGNALFKGVGHNKFKLITTTAHVTNGNKDARGSCSGDFNNDRNVDLLIGNVDGSLTLLKGNGHGVFTDVSSGIASTHTEAGGGTLQGVITFDFDNDGSLDTFVIKDGGPNRLLKQVAPLRFTDVTSQAGLSFTGPSRSAIAADFDRDGFQDLYLVLSNQPNRLYLNQRNGTFREAGHPVGADVKGNFTQAVVADFDADGDLTTHKPGDLDLLVVNSKGASALLRNNLNATGSLSFTNIAKSAGLGKIKKGKSAAFADMDNDGDIDIVVTQSPGAGNFLLLNNGSPVAPKFTKVKGIQTLNSPPNPTGITTGDFDNDGRTDVMIGDGGGGQQQQSGNTLLQNGGGVTNHWIDVTLVGNPQMGSNASAVGAQASLFTRVVSISGEVIAGSGQSQSSLSLHFGLLDLPAVDGVSITWPSGQNQVCGQSIVSDHRYEIDQTADPTNCQIKPLP